MLAGGLDDFRIEATGGPLTGDRSSEKEDIWQEQNGSGQQGDRCGPLVGLKTQCDHSDDSDEFAGDGPVCGQSTRPQDLFVPDGD